MDKTRILGIDFGLKRIGLALSDERKMIAFPWMTLAAEKHTHATVTKLLSLIDLYQKENGCKISKIVIGLPLMMSGKQGFLADEVNHFIQKLQENSELPILSWDERLTSVQAERSLRESSLSRKKRSKIVDKVAAVIILQNFLDFQTC